MKRGNRHCTATRSWSRGWALVRLVSHLTERVMGLKSCAWSDHPCRIMEVVCCHFWQAVASWLASVRSQVWPEDSIRRKVDWKVAGTVVSENWLADEQVGHGQVRRAGRPEGFTQHLRVGSQHLWPLMLIPLSCCAILQSCAGRW